MYTETTAQVKLLPIQHIFRRILNKWKEKWGTMEI